MKGPEDEVFAMEGGLKRQLSALTDCGYGSDAVYVIPDFRLSTITTVSLISDHPVLIIPLLMVLSSGVAMTPYM